MAKEQWFIKGENGVTMVYDLPLHEDIANRLKKGYLTRVADLDGNPYVEPESKAPDGEQSTSDDEPPVDPPVKLPPPSKSASKADWVGYAVHHGGMSPDDADA